MHAPPPALTLPGLSFTQLLEQQLFQRSRRFLWRLGRSLGGGSALYHQVVSVLQGGAASTPEDLEKVGVHLHLSFQCFKKHKNAFQSFFLRSENDISKI